MTSQQLIEARAALWHHNAEPILTLEEAASWVATTGFLLFLPRRQQLRAPSPTFVEACMGRLEHTPARPDIENALSLARRLFTTGEVFPLNLLGTLSEEPDFLIARDRLPWLFSLRGDRAWKAAPGGRTSPLNISVWKLLDEQGELTADQIRSGVGREVTDSSIRRALIDLWGTLRVFPRYHDGETTWALAKTLCPKECTKGTTTAQSAALSLFLADYLRSAIAATEDEAASFLSPLASRSRLREVLHALVSTRQLSSIPLGPNTLYYVAGELPEFPEIVAPQPAEAPAPTAEEIESVSEHVTPVRHEPHERIHKYTPRTEPREPYRRSERPAARREFKPRRFEGGYNRPSRDDREGRPERSETGFRPRREGGFKPRDERSFKPRREGGFKPREGRSFEPRSESGFRPPFRKPRPEADSGFAESDHPERAPRSTGEDRPPFRKSTSGERHKPFGQKFERSGERKPYGERKSYGARGERSERKPYGERKPYANRPDFRKSRDGEDRPHRDAESSERPPRKSFGKPGGFSKPGVKSGARPGAKSFGKGPGKGFGKTTGTGPKKSYGKPGGKSGFGKAPGKSFGKNFSKGPGKGPGKGKPRGPGKPRRSE